MRTLLLFTSLFLFSCQLFSQIRKGDVLLTPNNVITTSGSRLPTPITGNLAGLYALPEAETLILTTSPQYGFALSDRVMIGASFGVTAISLGGDVLVAASLSPHFRYYVVNKSNLQLHGGLRAGISIVESGVVDGNAAYVQPTAGLGLPISPGVLFAPELSYTVVRGENPLRLDFKFDFILGRNNRPANKAKGNYGRGSWMFGSQLGVLSLSPGLNEFRISPEAHYFLGRRLAIGAQAGIQLAWNDGTTESQPHLGLTTRYFPLQGQHIDVFAHLGFGVQGDGEASRGNGFLVDNLVTMDGGLGGLLFLRERVALEAGLGIRVFPQIETAEVALNLGLRFFMGGRAGAE